MRPSRAEKDWLGTVRPSYSLDLQEHGPSKEDSTPAPPSLVWSTVPLPRNALEH